MTDEEKIEQMNLRHEFRSKVAKLIIEYAQAKKLDPEAVSETLLIAGAKVSNAYSMAVITDADKEQNEGGFGE